MWSGIKTLALALWAPLLAGTLTAAGTWLVWRYTALPCTPENAVKLMCQPGPLARYMSTTVLHHCVIHASIAITITGGSDLMLFLRERQRNNEERRRNDQMMDLMKETIDQAAEERRQATEERRQSAEERRQAAEERRQAEERSSAERQAFLDALNRLTDAINRNGHERG
jgi:hypothetical protein